MPEPCTFQVGLNTATRAVKVRVTDAGSPDGWLVARMSPAEARAEAAGIAGLRVGDAVRFSDGRRWVELALLPGVREKLVEDLTRCADEVEALGA